MKNIFFSIALLFSISSAHAQEACKPELNLSAMTSTAIVILANTKGLGTCKLVKNDNFACSGICYNVFIGDQSYTEESFFKDSAASIISELYQNGACN